jgi:hypothetical protein
MQKEAFSVCGLTMPEAIEAAREANRMAQIRKEERIAEKAFRVCGLTMPEAIEAAREANLKAQIRKEHIADALRLVCGSTEPYSPSPEFIAALEEAEALLIKRNRLPTQDSPLYTLMETRNRLLAKAEEGRAARHSQRLTTEM